MKQKFKRGFRITKYVLYKETLLDYKELWWSFVGSFTGVGLIGFFQSYFYTTVDNLFLIGSFGASSVLIYGAINSPLSQPRNLIGGHVISAIVGVTAYKFLPGGVLIAAPFAVSLSIVLMQITKTLHPPGGATALIAIIGSEKIRNLGYWYVVSPVLTGVIILFIVALIFNNITSHRTYPASGLLMRARKVIRKKV